jgi:membrane associated rhomboid family serine protease
VLGLARPEFVRVLELDPAFALKQPWRFVTYLFIPPSWSLFWILISLYFTWLIGTNLESEWGPFKFNVYYLLGALGTTAAAWLTKEPQGNFWLNTSLFFAFATVFPNYQIYLFFFLPIRVKWLALLTFGYIAYAFFMSGLGTKVAIAVALGNYLLFFAGHLLALARGTEKQMQRAVLGKSYRAPPTRVEQEKPSRACAICGASQADGADIRVCSCEKCGSPRELCLDHARNH